MAALHQLLSTDFDELHDINDVCNALEELNEALTGTAFEDLQNFNATYLIITKAVRERMAKNIFRDSNFLNRFDARFAQYYLQALRNYVLQQPVAPAWKVTFDACIDKRASPFKIMALGVNAHVNNDIAQALHDCSATREHQPDYKKINRVIDACLTDVFDSLQSYQSIITPKRKALQPLYRPILKAIIRSWRWNAWRNYNHLQSRQTSVSSIENKANIMSKGTQILPL